MGREIMSLPPPRANERVIYGEQANHFIDFRYPEAGPPERVLVHVHGGFWRARFDLLHAGHLCAAMTAAGFVTANVEYRRVGEAGGGWPGTCQDVLAALRFVRRRYPELRTVLSGHSAGGHLALWLASEDPQLSGVVALAPVACLEEAWQRNLGTGAVIEFMGGSPAKLKEQYEAACPSRRPARVPRLLVHGTVDDVVPIAVSRTYCRLRCDDVAPPSVRELEGADHFDVIDPRSAHWPSVRDAICQAGR